MVEIKRDEEALSRSDTSEDSSEKYLLLYSKSKVYIYPTAYSRDNIPGFVTLVKRVCKQCPYYSISLNL